MVPATKIKNIVIPATSGQIDKLDSSISKEYMGVWQTPLGTNDKQIEKMRSQINAYYIILDNDYLPRHIIWLSFWSTIWAQLKYPLPVISLTLKGSNDFVKPLFKRLLPKIGVVGTLSLVYRSNTIINTMSGNTKRSASQQPPPQSTPGSVG